MRGKAVFGLIAGLVLSLAAWTARPASADPLKVGYSDWPGWVAWQVAIDKGWLKQGGTEIAAFEWFDYSASMDAYSAGKLDAVLMTNGDALVTGSGGGKSVMILITDYSNGNDQIIAKPGIKSLKELKGQKVGIEVGLVEHLLLAYGLQKLGMSDKDVELVNAKTNETPQVLGSGQVAAVGAWQPITGQAVKALPGSRPVYTSAEAPGLIYDVLAVNPATLSSRRDDWAKLIKVWDRVVKYIEDPKTQDDALKSLSARVGLTPAEYKPLLKGTKLFDLAAGKKAFQKGEGLASLYGSTKIADSFNVKYDVYKEAQDIDSYIDPSLTNAH
jgi:NitT/TauT family transport system substrate-binding protein